MKKKTPKLRKFLICGDREWSRAYEDAVRAQVLRLREKHGPTKLLIIAGGAPGVDTLVSEICYDENVHCAVVRALWDTRKNGAGPQRNEIMKLMAPEEVIGIHHDFDDSRGTKDMLDRAEKAGIKTRRITVSV